MSLPVRGAWVEMEDVTHWFRRSWRSLPVRGAWVEITLLISIPCTARVAPRAGSVG